VLTKKNDLFSELIEKMPRRKVDWLAMFTIEGIPGLNTSVLHLKEVQQSRAALLKHLGKAAPEKAAAMSTRALAAEFRQSLLSQGAEGEARWLKARAEIQSSLKLAAPELVDEVIRQGLELPPSSLLGPEIKSLLIETEVKLRDYKTIAEFDQWLAVKRLARKAN